MPTLTSDALVTGVTGNIVSIRSEGPPLMKNEVAYVNVGHERLKGEVLRVMGDRADLQIFEETQGVKLGDRVDLAGEMLSITLGPGMLGTVFDGLQNPLHELAESDGFFLKRGHSLPALSQVQLWSFTPSVELGDRVRAGDVLGSVTERRVTHKIMAPFHMRRDAEVAWIADGKYTVSQPIAKLKDSSGKMIDVTMSQLWPVRRPLPASLLKRRFSERIYPSEPLTTTTRIIDTFFPIAKGGTACIPGPFGAGKTVLQGLIARYSAVDIVIVVACGERAGEVLETITEFSTMDDPRSGGKLIDRTIIVCNTSSMPVAAREASIYTGITMGEYYRQMGLDVLLIADSTSRWAQAMRETSGRLEEIPGEEAFPAYLDSSIKGVYERAGLIKTNDQSFGSLTMAGTVSPAGGNFEEPVTQSTLSTVKCFLGLSYDRAYKRFYPAIDPLISWSRYLTQLKPYYDRHIDPKWTQNVKFLHDLFVRGNGVFQMMQVTGEEGTTLDDFLDYQKSLFVDMVYLQQDAFDPVDVSVPLERQLRCFQLIIKIVKREYGFKNNDQIREYFTRITGLFKNLNYSPSDSNEYRKYQEEIEATLDAAP